MRFILIFLILASFLSCKKESNLKTYSKHDSLQSTRIAEQSGQKSNFENILAKFPSKALPVADSTDFDDFQHLPLVNEMISKELKLNQLFSDASNFRINSNYNLSPDFKTISITFNKGEMEISTELLNFNSNGELIDHLEISYDEIAESAIRKWSEISKGSIIITHENYFEEPAKIEKTVFKILPAGKFQK